MSHDTVQLLLTVVVVALLTALTRGLPYLLFGGRRQIPRWLSQLSTSLPAAIMVILVVYCLRAIDLSTFPYGGAELLSVAVVAGLQLWRKNTILSILAGTVCYMVLIRTVFPL
ncbi:MAG: AzlD domain-containing protein [Oscillospiraceae bacterium]